MEGSRGVSTGKKLVQARLPFQVFRSPKDAEPRKKLEYTEQVGEQTEDCENRRDINSIPIICISDSENSPLKSAPEEMTGVTPMECDEAVEKVRKNKRGNFEEFNCDKSAKKIKLDVKSKLSQFANLAKNSGKSQSDIHVSFNEEKVKPKPDCIKSDESAGSTGAPTESDQVFKSAGNCDAPLKEEEVPGVPVVEEEAKPVDDVEVVVDVESEEGEEDLAGENCDGTTEQPVHGSAGQETDKTTPSSKTKNRKKTPKQKEKLEEAAKRREERERVKQEKEMKKQQEKEEKQKLKEEKEMQKKKELEEKEEIKRKSKEEKERKRQQEIEMKNEEKRRKEEEKKRKEEEQLKKKEEEASQKNKFAKEAVVFTNFFTKVDPEKIRKSEAPAEAKEEAVVFKPFAVKNRMRLAPINRNPLDTVRRDNLDSALLSQDVFETYLTQLRCGDIKPGHSTCTWPLDEIYQDDDNDVEELPLEGEPVATAVPNPRASHVPHAKLLQFAENRRPPYWGTWRKKCPAIGPRRPFGTYKEFEYDVDSDEEWEEEEPGESLHGSDDEREKDDQDGEDDYEVDNDLFVPHGYLSEDEATPDDTWSVEQQKEKLKLLGEQFDQERNEKTRQLRPVVLGCIWTSSDPAGTPKVAAMLLRCLPWFAEEATPPIALGPETPDSPEGRETDGSSPAGSARRGVFPDEAIPFLIPRVHGATVRRRAIAKEFAASWARDNPNAPLLSVAAVSRKVVEFAKWQECPEPPLLGRYCWFVPRAVREQYGCGEYELPRDVHVRVASDDVEMTPVPASNTPKITKFTKVLTEEERRLSLKCTPLSRQSKPDLEDNSLCTSTPTRTGDIASMTSQSASPIVEKAVLKLNMFRAPDTPLPKKRIAILFSSPCGVPIAKPISVSGVAEVKKSTQSAATTNGGNEGKNKTGLGGFIDKKAEILALNEKDCCDKEPIGQNNPENVNEAMDFEPENGANSLALSNRAEVRKSKNSADVGKDLEEMDMEPTSGIILDKVGSSENKNNETDLSSPELAQLIGTTKSDVTSQLKRPAVVDEALKEKAQTNEVCGLKQKFEVDVGNVHKHDAQELIS